MNVKSGFPRAGKTALKISISGIRGVAGSDLTPDAVFGFARAFAELLGRGRVAVATDSRASRLECFRAVCEGLSAGGCSALSLGVAPTPTLQLSVPFTGSAGGVCITASHNPPEWNGLKFYGPDGILLDEPGMEKVIGLYDSAGRGRKVSARPPGVVEIGESARLHHVDSVLGHIDSDAIRAMGFRVAVDSVNGAGGLVNNEFFGRLGCVLIPVNEEISGSFNRPPEPVPGNLEALGRAVLESGAEIGFAQDPDADRLAVVLEDGRRPGEDYTLALAVRHVLEKTPGTVVTNLSATRALDDICAEFGQSLVRTKTGERNVVGGMKEHQAVIGGEGNGGVIYPRIHFGRDSFAGMGLILQAMALTGKSASGLLSEIPGYFIIKEKASAESLLPLEELGRASFFSGADMDFSDGVRASWGDEWVHVRGSGTEPVVRLIAEAKDEKSARALYGRLLSAVSA